MSSPNRPDEPERVVIRDKRRIDPQTGETRTPDPEVDPAAAAAPDPDRAPSGRPERPEGARSSELAERTADLQRVQAEFANYRKRMERDRVAIGERAVGGVLAVLLPILDDIDRARSHGDLTGAFKAVADQFDAVLAKLGLVAFADPGDPFDPAIHEAVMHDESDEVALPTATTVMRRGYKHGDRLLRPAMVGVTDPSTAPNEASATPPENATQQESATPPAATSPPEPASPSDNPLPDTD